MFGLFPTNIYGHVYTFATSGLPVRDKVYASRSLAENVMYKLIAKYNLHISKIYEDHHDKTYICNNGVRFYIQRSM